MEKVNALKETIKVFVDCVEEVKTATESRQLDNIERKAVSALQLAEVQVAEAGDDLYYVVLAQRRKINNGEITEVKKDETSANSKGKGSNAKIGKRKTSKKA